MIPRPLLTPAGLALAAVLCGCAPRHGLATASRLTPPTDFAEATSDTTPAPPDPAWWRALGDPALDDLVDIALSESWDTRIVEAELRRARSTARLQAWRLAPVGALDLSVERGRTGAPETPSSGSPGSDPDHELWSAGFAAAWEIDVFGRLRAEADAGQAEVRAVEAARRGVSVSLAAEIAQQYVALRGGEARLSSALANARLQSRTVAVTEALRREGRVTAAEVASARAQLATTEVQAAVLEGEVGSTRRTLALLAGPRGQDRVALLTAADIPRPPDRVAIGDPMAVLARRPDIAEARARLEADALRSRVSDWWPRLTLSGGGGLTGVSLDDLISDAAFGYAFGPRIDWPILDFRREQLRHEARTADAEAAYERFDRTAFTALADVERALVEFAAARRAARHATGGAAAARDAALVARVRYREGAMALLDLLDVERRQAEAQDAEAIARTREALAYLRIGRALGSGWR